MKSLLPSLLFLVIGAAGCEGGLGDPTGATCPSTPTDTYANFGADFFTSYCNGCHSANATDRHDAPSGVDFDTQAEVQTRASDIDRAVGKGPNANNTFMPDEDAPSLLQGYVMPTDAERERLSQWLACGAN